MTRVLLLVPSRTYRAHDFIEAARRLDVDVLVGTDRPSPLGGPAGRTVTVDLAHRERGCEDVRALDRERPLDAIVPVDDGSTLVAATASAALGLPHNPVAAVEASRDKAQLRALLARAGLPTPRFTVWPADADPEEVPVPRFPVVVKPVDLSGSRGVIRADDPDGLAAAFARVAAIVGAPDVCPPGGAPQRILVEDFIPGREVAVEGLLRGGRLDVLAIFDKPDPLDGPFFAETIYVTPSRLPSETQDLVTRTVAAGTLAVGLTEGPIHAEVRLNDAGAWILEIAARSIGGLCSRTLRFGAGISLEEVIVRHAAGLPLPSLARAGGAAGVMMLPIRERGRLRGIGGREAALAVPRIEGLTITIPPGDELVPLPEGDRYLGFIFARAERPEDVEAALRRAYACLSVELDEQADD